MLKYSYIAFSRIRSMLRDNAFLFCILLAGIVVCNIAFIYFFGNVYQAFRIAGARQFEIRGEGEIDILETEKELAGYDSLVFYSQIGKESILQLPNLRYDPERYIAAYSDDGYFFAARADMSVYSLGSLVSELEKGSTVILPDYLIRSGIAPEDITLGGSTYSPVGSSVSCYFLISEKTFSDNGLTVSGADLRLPAEMSGAEIDEYIARAEELFGSGYVFTETTKAIDSSELLGVIVPAALVYLVCLIALLYIMAYMFEESAFELSVYELLGATRGSLIALLCSVQLFVLLISALIACLLHSLLYPGFFSLINIYEFSYTLPIYLYSVLITVGITMLFTLSYLSLKLKRYAVVNFRRFIA